MLRSDLPTFYGEKFLADRLLILLDEKKYDFWFNFHIPRAGDAKEVDGMIYDRSKKIFILIEVKGLRIDDIKEICKDKIVLSNNTSFSNAWFQASDNSKRLKSTIDYYKQKNIINKDKTFIFSPVVAFPLIKRTNFNERFKTNSNKDILFHELSDSTIFAEDLESTNNLLGRITVALEKPIYNKSLIGSIRGKELSIIELEDFTKILFPKFHNKYNKAYDPRVMLSIEKECLKILDKINTSEPIIIEGYAGTGKTFIGFNLARILAQKGKKVLFTCYNKTLAVDLQRLKYSEPEFRNDANIRNNLIIKDIFKILSELHSIFPNKNNIYSSLIDKKGLSKFNQNNTNQGDISETEQIDHINAKPNVEVISEYDKWAIEIIDEVLEKQNMKEDLYKYDYIVADETQDFKNYMFDLVELLLDDSSQITYIYGKNQILYIDDESSEYNRIRRIKSKISFSENSIEKRRVFRTTDKSFLIAQGFILYYPNSFKAVDWIAEKLKDNDDEQQEFEFDRKGGNLPNIYYCDGEYNSMKNKIKELLNDIINRNKELRGNDCDIMILVPHYGFTKRPIIEALNELNKQYIDYTIDDFKRLDYSNDEIRICTYFSARGLEANFILILGFNSFDIHLRNMNKEHIVDDLGYIILSRAKYDTYLLNIDEAGIPREGQAKFLEDIIHDLSN